MDMDIQELKERIDTQCKGWSGDVHWVWQNQLFSKIPTLRDVCILGVYFGRDTAYAAAWLAMFRGEDFSITAVDKFSDTPCADWESGTEDKTWEEAGFGQAPSVEQTRDNLTTLDLADHVTLVKADAMQFLRETDKSFDLIYIDTSHDYETTRNTIQLALKKLRPLGLLAGDDFSDEGTWGVAKAVREVCPKVRVFKDWIWYAAGCELRVLDDASA